MKKLLKYIHIRVKHSTVNMLLNEVIQSAGRKTGDRWRKKQQKTVKNVHRTTGNWDNPVFKRYLTSEKT
jgi:hypothetical protein